MTVKAPAIKYFDLEKGDTLTQADLEAYVAEAQAVCDNFPAVVDSLKPLLTHKYDKVYAVGIGDSWYSAESAKLDFWKNTGIQMEVLESQEFNNYYIDYMPANSLVFICSGGGSAGRTVESSFLAQKRGAKVVAVTLTPKSRLTSSTDNVLCYATNNSAFIDGSRNYMSLTLLVELIGIRMGAWNGTLTAAAEKALYKRLVKDMKSGFKTCMKYEKQMKKLMKEVKDETKFYFLGAGPSWSLALYGAAKFMEQAAADGIPQQLEEYGHEQYWVHNRRSEPATIFSICPAGKTFTRCLENIDEMNFLGKKTVLLTSGKENGEKSNAEYTFVGDASIPENDYWMVAGNLFARMANFFTQYIGFNNQRFQNGEQFVEHYRTIHFTRFVDEVAELDIPIPDDKTIAERGAFGLVYDKKAKKK